MIVLNFYLLGGNVLGFLEDFPEPIAPRAVAGVGQDGLERGQNWTVDLKEVGWLINISFKMLAAISFSNIQNKDYLISWETTNWLMF